MGDLYDDEGLSGSPIPPPVSPSPIQRKALPKRTTTPGGGLYDDETPAQGVLYDEEPAVAEAPSAAGPSPEGVLPTMLRAAVPKIIPGLMGLGGAVAGGAAGAFGGPAAPVTIPLGAVAGGIAAESQGGKVNKWIASKLFAPDTIAEYNAQLEANAKAHEIAAPAGEMVGNIGSMFAGGGVAAKAIPKLVQAGKIATAARAAGKTAAEAQAAYKKTAGASLMGGKLLDSAISGAVMVGGGEARENPDATLWSTTKAAIQGGVTMAPLAFVPHAKSVFGAISWRAPTDATILATANTLYDHFVNGKEINVTELRDQIGKDIPSFMLMNGIMSVFGRVPLLPSGAKKLQEAKTPQQVIDDPVAVHDVLNKALETLAGPDQVAEETAAKVEEPSPVPTIPAPAAEPVTRKRLTKKRTQAAQQPVQAVEPEPAAVTPPVAETPAAGETAAPVKPPEVEGLTYNGVQKIPGQPDQHVFTDKKTSSTFYSEDISPEHLASERDRVRAKFEKPSVPPPVAGPSSVVASADAAQGVSKAAELMPPLEWHGSPDGIRLAENATDPMKAGDIVSQEHRKILREAMGIKNRRPVSAEAIDQYGMTPPTGYVREGDRYVFKGESAPTQSAPAPAAAPPAAPAAPAAPVRKPLVAKSRAAKAPKVEVITPEVSITTGIYGVSIEPLSKLPEGGVDGFVERNWKPLSIHMNTADRKRGIIGTLNHNKAIRMLEEAYADKEKESKPAEKAKEVAPPEMSEREKVARDNYELSQMHVAAAGKKTKTFDQAIQGLVDSGESPEVAKEFMVGMHAGDEAPAVDRIKTAAQIIANRVNADDAKERAKDPSAGPHVEQSASRFEKGATKLIEAIDNKDADTVSSIIARVPGENEGSKSVFERETGTKLAKTVTEIRRQVDQWAGVSVEERLRRSAAIGQEAMARREKEKQDAKKAAWDKLTPEQQENEKSIEEFTSGKPEMLAGRISSTLAKMVSIKDKVAPLSEHVRRLVKAGAALETREEPVIKPMSRLRFNRADQREQDEHARKMKAAGSKTVFLVGGYDLGKTAYDYAAFLESKKTDSLSVKASAPAAIGEKAVSVPRIGDDVTWMAGGREAIGTIESIHEPWEGQTEPHARINYFGMKDVPLSALTIKRSPQGEREASKARAATDKEAEEKIRIERSKSGNKTVSVPSKDKLGIAPNEQKRLLLEMVDKAISKVPEDSSKLGTVKFEVPGDGEYTILENKDNLSAFRKMVESKFPTTKMPPGRSNIDKLPESRDDKINKAADIAIDQYGDAAKAAQRIKELAQKYEPTDDIEADKKNMKRWLSVADELESRANVTSVPEHQKTDKIGEVRQKVAARQYDAEKSQELKDKRDREFKAIAAMKAHPKYSELRKALTANLEKQVGGLEKNPLPKDGDVLNVFPEGRGAPEIRKMQDDLASSLGLRRAKPKKNRYAPDRPEFNLSSYWKDVAADYKPEPELETEDPAPLPTKTGMAAIPKKAAAGIKEPWEMTEDQYVASRIKEFGSKEWSAVDAEGRSMQESLWRDEYRGKIIDWPRTADVSEAVLAALPASVRDQVIKFNEKAREVWNDHNAAWNMPYREFLKTLNEEGRRSSQSAKELHREAVKRAMAAGKTVPATVLADYPELTGKAPKTGMAAITKRTEPRKADAAPIEDFGEKIGGARKDLAERGYAMKAETKKETDSQPVWRKQFRSAESVKNPGQWTILDTKSKWGFGGNSQTFSSKEDAEKAIPIYAVAQHHTTYQNNDGTHSIYKKIGERKHLKVVRKDFPSREEAMKYMAQHAEELLNAKTSFGEEILPVPEIAKRTGVERRTKDATPEMFQETFAPRGIEFGNWNNQEERQMVMNHAYDGLLDLADTLGVPPKALMLNGDLAIAFGARGQGLVGAKAHYERDYSAINLSKMKGAGSLAHEWMHAFDHYLARLDTKATSEKKPNERGDMVYPETSPKMDLQSHGYSYKSKLREELKRAYHKLVESLYKKSEKYVEDTQRVDKFLGAARDSLQEQIKSARQELAQDMTNYHKSKGGYSSKSIKYLEPASAEQLSEFDKLANTLVEGGNLELKWKVGDKPDARGFSTGGRYTNDTLESINSIFKAARNRSGFRKEGHGYLDKIAAAVKTYSQRLEMLEKAKAGTESERTVSTDFSIEAKKMDQARTGDYWSEPHEMTARAFAAYVEDRVAQSGGQSDFLVYHAHGGIILPMIDGFIARPYPEGKEREVIGKLFDDFVKEIKTRETDRGTAMYALPTKLLKGDYDERDIRDQINHQNPPADWKGDDGDRRGRELSAIRGLQQELGEGSHAAQVASVVRSDAFSRSRRFGALAEIARRNGVEAVPIKGDNGQLPFAVGDRVFLPDSREHGNAAIHEIGHVLDHRGVPEIRKFIAAVNRGSEYFTGTYRAVQEHPYFGPAYRENARKELGLDPNKELSANEQMMVDNHVGDTVAADIALNNLMGRNTWDAIRPSDIGLRGDALKRVMEGETERGTAMYSRGSTGPGVSRTDFDRALAEEVKGMKFAGENVTTGEAPEWAKGIADREYRSDSGQVRALTVGNKSHFFLDRYDSQDQLRQDIREEAMHRVINEVGGPAWQKAASQVYGGARAAMIVAEIKRNYGYKPGTEAFNHELLAKMVRDGQQNAGMWRRAVDAVVSMLRDAGRRLGLDLKMTDAELRNLANGILKAKERQMAGGQVEGKAGAAARTAGTFYSGLAEALDKMPLKQAIPGDQMLNKVRGLPGVKAQEIEETGFGDWLKMQRENGKPVTKEAAAEFLKANGVKVETVVKGDKDKPLLDFSGREIDSGITTKFHGYAPAGGVPGTYREVLLTLPKTTVSRADLELSALEHYGKKYDDLNASQRNNAEEYVRDARGQGYADDFKSTHWSETNVLAHMLMDERRIPLDVLARTQPELAAKLRAEGKTEARALHMIEGQSDLHAAGQAKGYETEPTKESAQAMGYSVYRTKSSLGTEAYFVNGPDNFRDIPNIGHEAESDAWKSAFDHIKKHADTVPNLPMRGDAWKRLVIRKMLREAADGGYDMLTWSTGADRAAKWGSERVEWRKVEAPYVSGRGLYEGWAREEGLDPQDRETRRKWMAIPIELRAKWIDQEMIDTAKEPAWTVAGTEQSGGEHAGMNLEQAARERGMLLEQSGQTVRTKDDLRKIVTGILRNPEAGKVDKLTDRIWTRMQTETEGTSMPRKEFFEFLYDKSFVQEANKIVDKMDKTAKVGNTSINHPSATYDMLDRNSGLHLARYFSQPEMERAVAEEPIRWVATIRETFGKTVHAIPITDALRGTVQQGQPLYARTFRNPSVTREQDAAYKAAVDAGDLATAQRMVDEAAKGAGYNVGPVYRGDSRKGAKVFGGLPDEEIKGGKITETGRVRTTWFTSSPMVASDFGKNTYRVFLRLLRPDASVSHYVEGLTRASDGGATTIDGVTAYVVKSSEQIKSADPITRDDSGRVIPLSERFNPQSPDIRYARGEKKEPPAARALSAVRRSPGEYKHLLSWTKTNHGDLYDPALSDHENAARVLAGLADSAERPENLRGVAGIAFQRFKTALGKGATPEGAVGPAGSVAGEPEAPAVPSVNPLDDLANVIRPTAESKNIPKDADATWSKQAKVITDAMTAVKTTAIRAWEGLKQAQQGRPQWHGTIKPIIGDRQEAIGKAAQKAQEFLGTAHEAFTAREQEAIADWMDAGGKIDVLQANAAKTTDKYRQGYIDAQNMTPEMLAAAKAGQEHFDKQFAKAYEAGVLEDALEDYIHRTYEKDTAERKGAIAEVRSGAFETKPGLAKQRFYQYDADAEAAGLNPVKSWSKRIAAHAYSLDRAIANRAFVDGVFKMKAPDGRPMADMQGIGIPLEGKDAERTGSFLVPHAKSRKGEVGDPEYRGDFIPYDHPAFRKRKWMMKDADGKPVFMQADMMVHPDMLPALDAVLGRSKFLAGNAGRAAKKASSDVKQTMLGFFSLFHPVQLGIHAAEHRVNPFNLVEKVDYDNQQHSWLIRHGLEVHDHAGMMDMAEGTVGGGGFLKHVPKLGAWAGAFQDFVFKHYIPRLKMTMALHALERNTKIYGKELTADEIGYLTASEANQAFGGLNYEMMGRSRTTQDVLRMAMLAPDFFEARARFVGEAFSKYGAEQRVALMLGAGAMYVTARILNQMLNDDPHLELKNAFNIVVGKRLFGLRTIQGDLIHLVTDPGKFMFNRVNPLYVRTLIEAGTGRDYFGRERTGVQQLGDLAQTVVPIGLRGITNPSQNSLLDSLANSIGFVEKKYHTPAEELAHKISGGRGATNDMTPDEKKKHAMMTDIREKVAAGDAQAAFKAVRAGEISSTDAMRLMKDAKKPELVRSTSSMPLVHVLEVWDKATESEKKELKPKIIMGWMRYRKTKTRDEIVSMHKELKARGLAT